MLFNPEELKAMASDDAAKLDKDRITQAWREPGRRMGSLEDSPLFSRQMSLGGEQE